MTIEEIETGSKKPRSTTLTKLEEAMIITFLRHMLHHGIIASMHFSHRFRIRWLAGDACITEKLARSALHRCFQRHGISRLPDVDCPRCAYCNLVHRFLGDPSQLWSCVSTAERPI